ncbi:MAG: NYN domain-containing protein, partial [Hyphomicrobiaceae bacterium]|nr:NYN domain-containing protein [Hyphomicrobiaceae bacterium]
KRKSEEAARRFAKDSSTWLAAIATGRLITPTNGPALSMPRRIVMNRCYGNPVPRRNAGDNSTDMSSFPFVRHHFLRSGFEVIDCPPLTAQLKNSADIRMVMDVRDYLLHDTYFDEFVILSSDADFTPVLHRLRQHARRTVVYANDYTAAPYTAICDGEVREADLIALLMGGDPLELPAPSARAEKVLPSPEQLAAARTDILGEVLAAVASANQPVPLEALADRAVRVLGHDRTVGTGWGGAGSFRDLLLRGLPAGLRLSEAAPYYVIDTARQAPAALRAEPVPVAPAPALRAEPAPVAPPAPRAASDAAPAAGRAEEARGLSTLAIPPMAAEPAASGTPAVQRSAPPQQAARAPIEPRLPPISGPVSPQVALHAASPSQAQAAQEPPQASLPVRQPQTAAPPAPAAPRGPDASAGLQQTIARIYEASQVPPLSPSAYLKLFEVMASEITVNGLSGARTLINIAETAREQGIDTRKDDVRFILEVVSEADPWFEGGASAAIFAARFRNFVIARCKGQGLQLSADELDLVDAWFTGTQGRNAARPQPASLAPQHAAPTVAPALREPAPSRSAPAPTLAPQYAEAAAADEWWAGNTAADYAAATQQPAGVTASAFGEPGDPAAHDDEFPRIVRTRVRI